jgi:outer membrane protein assembly factor BamB
MHPLTLTLLLAAGPADWPEFRGPTAQGHAAGHPPAEWGPDRNVAWKVPVPPGWASPVVAGGRVYLSAAGPDGDGPKPDQLLRVLALDLETGRTVWDREVFRQSGGSAPRIHAKNSHASPTPVVAVGRVYAHFGHAGTACLAAADGAVVWATRELAYEPVHGNGGSPVLVGDKLIFSIDGADRQAVVALDAATGKLAWETPRDAKPARPFSFGTPLVIDAAGRRQVVSAGSSVVMSLDPATGKELWRVRYGRGYSVVPRPVFAGGLVVVCTGYDAPTVIAVRPDGTGDVTDTHVAWTAKKNAPLNPSPLAVGESLYTVSDAGVLSCLELRTGNVLWTERVGKAFSASPVYAGGRVYLLAEDGTATVFTPGPAYQPVATNKLGERALASPAVAGDALLVRTDKHLWKIAGK